jgi:signal transduction histidine kinase
VGIQIPIIDFFARYGNVYDIKSQYLAVLDRSSVQLIHPVRSLVGTPFFGNHTQEVTGHNKILNNLIQTVMSGKPDFAIYEFKNSQRLTTGYPIFLQGKPAYFTFIITPVAYIYSHVNEVLFTERLKVFSIIAGTIAAIVALILFLIKWNSILDKQVKRRTKELEESNEQLKAQDKMEKEFINIAAHELRTPIQPILSLSDVLYSKVKDSEQSELLGVINRSAKKLHRLAENILDASKIESKSLTLNKQRLNLNDIISSIVEDYRNQIQKANVNVKFSYDKHNNNDLLEIEADKERITQVISNLLSNALKFTEEGYISISAEKKGKDVIVSVKDTGVGIHQEILPRLFTKFATKSDKGTGLGLFISKSIIEAHGGKIWAENNSDGKGATFAFSLPID